MSVVPLMFRDWWDDFDRPVSRLMDQHFGRALNRDELLSRFSDLGLERPLRSIFRDRYYRPWRNVARQASSGSSTIQIDSKDNFQVCDHRFIGSRSSSQMFLLNVTSESRLVCKLNARLAKPLGDGAGILTSYSW
ncbi:hypothetical protein QLX08_007728 [Tetragonisca angustula]|uniref:Uncharacterized protein n=1 Tax=Tetragonisca angustula TaxID=166442 RepID=A0AAW0ZNC9_9HYME